MTGSTMTMTQSPSPAAPREQVVRRIEALGAIAVVRLSRAEDVLPAVAALQAGGIHAVEVTMTVPGALHAIERLAREAGDEALVGVGSVLDAETARRAVEAGARSSSVPSSSPTSSPRRTARGPPCFPAPSRRQRSSGPTKPARTS